MCIPVHLHFYKISFPIAIIPDIELQVALEDPKRFRIEMTFSRGADLSPLEVIIFFLNLRIGPFKTI